MHTREGKGRDGELNVELFGSPSSLLRRSNNLQDSLRIIVGLSNKWSCTAQVKDDGEVAVEPLIDTAI